MNEREMIWLTEATGHKYAQLKYPIIIIMHSSFVSLKQHQTLQPEEEKLLDREVIIALCKQHLIQTASSSV